VWSELCAWAVEVLAELESTLVIRLSAEVDPHQAAMFGRRFFALESFLKERADVHPEAQAYLIGLAIRSTGILAKGARIATRIRALVDYLFSYGALLDYQQTKNTSSIEELAHSARFSAAGAGIEHAAVAGMTDHGPAHVNVLTVRGRRLQCIDARGADDLVALVQSRGAQAGVSGGFFLYSEPDIVTPSRRGDPVGGLVDDGVVVSGPVYPRGAIWQLETGAYGVGVMSPVGWSVVDSAGVRVHITAVNPATPCAGSLYNRAFGAYAPAGIRGVALVGGSLIEPTAAPLAIPLAGAVLQLPEGTPYLSGLIRWQPPEHQPIRAAMMGGPMLGHAGGLRCDYVAEHFAGSAPPLTFSQDETFDQNLLPRMGAGLRDDGSLVFAAIDGRNLKRALGFTLQMTGRFLMALGCQHVTNLDGGSSKRMVVGGRVVDLSTTELRTQGEATTRVRKMHSSILIE
jgi:hypothetical protein